MSSQKLAIEVFAKVMGRSLTNGNLKNPLESISVGLTILDERGIRRWCPETNPTDDYSVLEYVRQNWSTRELAEFANRVWEQAQRYQQPYPFAVINEEAVMLSMVAGYEVGDYARAALAIKDLENWPENWPTCRLCDKACDKLVGFCACGVWHRRGEFELHDGILMRFGEPVED